jgi:methylenetetrahydrofolate dehydrogenase (NADP+)/methenyltetrahydrofolate cyclohydrolase
MIIDGKKIAEEIKLELKQTLQQASGKKLVLAVVLVGEDPASIKFVEYKKKFGEAIGVEVRVFEYEADIEQTDLAEEINRLAVDEKVEGIVVQLPLPACAGRPKQIETEKILNIIPAEKDVDALTADASVDAPVAEAVMEILKRGDVDLNNKKILVIGQGKLVGRPVSVILAQEGYDVDTADINTKNLKEKTLQADIIISGVGKPGLIKADMVKKGVILIDCGTSELKSQLSGDIDPTCADKASLFTPVPGGVGPIVVAMLFKNLLKLALSK